MFAFDQIDRRYAVAKDSYRLEVPEHFNFAFDVIDVRAKEADKTAILAVSSDGETVREVRYSDLAEDSSRFANALIGLGLQKGDFACVVIGRVPAWYTVLFGCMKAGVVAMPGTNLLTAKDIAYRVNHCGAKAVIVTEEHCDKVDGIRESCPSLAHFIVAGAERDGWHSLEVLSADQPAEIDRNRAGPFRSTDMMMAYFTSGTTAMPKMVPRDFGYGLAACGDRALLDGSARERHPLDLDRYRLGQGCLGHPLSPAPARGQRLCSSTPRVSTPISTCT